MVRTYLRFLKMKFSEMTHKDWLAIFVVVSAIGFGIAGTALPPSGIIDSSILYLIAQLLIYSATILGFGDVVKRVTQLINSIKKPKA